MVTTIQIREETRRKLARLKAASGESYDELLTRLLGLVPEGDDEGRYAEAFRVGLLNARLDVKEGRLTDHAKAKSKYGV